MDGLKTPILCLIKVEKLMPSYKEKLVSYHEAGRVLMAKIEGFQFGNIIIEINGNGQAELILNQPCHSSGAEDYLKRRIRVLLGGALAQCIVLHPNDPKAFEEALSRNASADWKVATELAWALRNIASREEVSDDAARIEVDEVLQMLVNETANAINDPINYKPLMNISMLCLTGVNELHSFSPSDFDAPSEVIVTQEKIEKCFC